MSTIRLLQRAAPGALWRILALLAAATTANVVMLVLLPESARLSASGASDLRHPLLYALAFGLFLYSLRAAGGEIIAAAREQISIERLALLERAALAPADERPDTTVLAARLAAIAEGTAGLPKAALAAQAAMACMMAVLYIGVISFTALAIAGGLLMLVIAVFLDRLRSHAAAHEIAVRRHAETRAAQAASPGHIDALEAAIIAETGARTRADCSYFDLNAFALLVIFALAALMAFVAPPLAQLTQTETAIILTAVLFMAGPITVVVDAAPDFVALDAALEDLERLRRETVEPVSGVAPARA